MKRHESASISIAATLLAAFSSISIWGVGTSLNAEATDGIRSVVEAPDSVAGADGQQADGILAINEEEMSISFLNGVIPPSPQAAALARYAEYPVSHTTGIPDISVPLYEIDLGGYTLPISISYHASGARPDDMPGYVGTGWTLNAGGAISRTILGKPDRPMTGSQADLPCYSDTFVGNMLSDIAKTGGGTYYHYLASIVGDNLDHDTESDRYTFNVAGKTGVFRYSHEDRAYVILNNSNWLVEAYAEGLAAPRFRIVTNDGLEYEFNQEERTGAYDEFLEKSYVTSWYLTKISSPSGDIAFNYDATGGHIMIHRKEVKATSGPQLELKVNEYAPGGAEYWYETHSRKGVGEDETVLYYEQRPVKEIVWNGGRVVFEYVEEHRYSTLLRLTMMKVYDPDGNLRKSVAFDNTDNWPSGNSLTGRRMLVKVTDSEQGIWSFGYDREVKLPQWKDSSMCHNACRTDFWGYLNTSDASWYEDVFTKAQSNWLHENAEYTSWRIGTRDRSPSLAHTRAGTLTSVTFPTGGKTVYEYELNTGCGGLRLKSQTLYESEGAAGKKTTYDYMESHPTSETPEFLMDYLSYRQMNQNPDIPVMPEQGISWPYEYRTCVPYPIRPVTAPSYPVAYTRVRENRPDGSSVLYEYEPEEFDRLCGVGPSEFTHPFLYEQSLRDYGIWEPLLLSRTVCDKTGKAVLIEENTYERKILQTFSTGVRTVCPYYECMVPPPFWGPATTVTPALVAKFGVLQHKPSTAYVRANLLTSTTVTDCQTGFSTATKYSYDDRLRTMMPRTVTECGSDGVDMRTEYKYPFDLNDETSSRMVEFFYMTDVPVETASYSGKDLLARKRTEYGFYNDWCYPTATRSWYAPTASSLQSPPSVLPVRERVSSYNNAGRPHSVTVNETDVTTFTWNTAGDLLLSSTAPGGLTTTYTHKPLFGLATVTLPNTHKTSYFYNSAGMLSSVSDNDGLLSRFSYSIANHPDASMAGSGNSVTTERSLHYAGATTVKSRQYHDGLGRPTVSLEGGANTAGKYLYSAVSYDALGRESQAVLPSVGGTAMESKTFAQVKTLSNTTYSDQYAWSETTYDGLGRPVNATTPGDAWHSAGKAKTTQYIANTANSVRLYSAPMNSMSLSTGSYYAEKTLQGIRTVDEDGLEMTVYTDRLGRKVLERRGPESQKGQNDTYFVYNALGQLRFVLSPAYQQDADLTEYAYEYRYDQHGNVVYKAIPGAGYTQYWYDRAGRLAYMQDANLRSKALWRFFVYDKAGRLAVQGVCKACTRDETVNAASYTGGTTGFMQTGWTLANASRIQQATLETVSYYDGYTFAAALDTDLSKATTQSAKGLQTGSVIYASDGGKSVSALYYDYRGNVIESRERTYAGTLRTLVNTYTYTGQPLKSTLKDGGITMVTDYTYDAKSGLLTATEVTINGKKQKVSAITYDDLGRISSVTRGSGQGSGGTVSYTYNLHGQTKSITGPGFSQELFYADGVGTKLYNGSVSSMKWSMGTEALTRGYRYFYNSYGWLTSADYGEGDGLTSNKDRYTERSTAFTRNGGITKLQRFGLTAGGTYGKVDDLTVTYSGNRMASVSDAAPAVTQTGSMDFAGGSSGSTFGYNGFGALTSDASRGITSITYDDFGNPLKISYSDGSSTQNVYLATGEKLKSTHAVRLSTGSMAFSAVSYRGPAIYIDGRLYMVLFPGGYTSYDTGGVFTFHYYTQDYLGNNRAVINGSTGLIEQTVAYYPYGAVIAELGTSTVNQPYKFGGKELMTANGLNEYDFGARQYWSSVPCFTRIDPMAEKYTWLSPYLYCANNPVNFVDPTGKVIQMTSGSSVSDMVNVLINMSKITDDALYLYKHEDGSFQICISSFNDGHKKSGTRLVRRLNGSEKSMTIDVTTEGVNQERSESPQDAINGKGTNTLVTFNPDFNPVIPELDETSGKVVNGVRPAYIGLAHEMIHADRGMRGVAFDYTQLEYHSFINSNAEVDVEALPKEEAATVGFNYLKQNKSFNITENTIRKELGLRPRGAYKVYKKR